MLSDEEDSDKEGEQGENAEERIAHELFEGQGEEGDEDLDDVASQRRATEKEFEDLNVEGSEEESGWFFAIWTSSRIRYLSHCQATKAQVSLHNCAAPQSHR